MPPSTSRRPRTRRLGSSPPAEPQDSSPSRPRAKRRKVHDRTPTLLETVAPLSPQDLVNSVISTLSISDEGAVVAEQYANEKNYEENTAGVTAYAKVSGANWTYYIKDLVVKIGRPPDPRSTGNGSPTPPPQQKHDDVHIDLGPSKLISRNHATISYDTDGEHNWQLHVHGRNGVRINEKSFKKDTIIVLRSGNVIDIGGTEMMFVLPNHGPEIAPEILRRVQVHEYHVDDEVLLPMHRNSPPPTPTISRQASAAHLIHASGGGHMSQGRPNNHNSHVPMSGGVASSSSPTKLVIETDEDIDYSLDINKEKKPHWSYALMIAQAILSSESEQLTLASIYQFIMDKYAFYRHSNMGWQNSIRHNLSLNKAFRKIPRRVDEPGKGMKWELLPEFRDEYIRKLSKASQHKTSRRESLNPINSPTNLTPSTPLDPTNPSHRFTATTTTARSVTPPPSTSYQIQPLEAYTPDRGSRIPALRTTDKMLSSETPAKPLLGTGRPHLRQNASGLLSIPASDGLDPPSPLPSTTTPAPQRRHPRLAPPSASQLPSSYLPTSSPAPFWKYVSFGSTPAKPPVGATGEGGFYSPLKMDLLQSSSPPPPVVKRPRELGSPLKERSAGGAAFLLPTEGEEEDEAEGLGGLGDFPGIDLARGFEKIGRFHVNGRVSGKTGTAKGTGKGTADEEWV